MKVQVNKNNTQSAQSAWFNMTNINYRNRKPFTYHKQNVSTAFPQKMLVVIVYVVCQVVAGIHVSPELKKKKALKPKPEWVNLEVVYMFKKAVWQLEKASDES